MFCPNYPCYSFISFINDNLEQQAAALFSSLYNRSNTEVRYTDLIQILGGGTPKTGETAYWNGNIAFFTPKDVGTPYTFITEKTITEEGLSHCNSRLYPVNTVFVTARGTVGKVGLSGIPMAMNQSCYALVGKETHQLLVYFYTLKAVDRLKHKASGAVFDAITTRDFDSEQIMKLSDDDAKAFLCVAEPMFQEMLTDATGSRAAQLARASAAEAEKVLFSHVVHLLSVVLEHLEECVVDDVERKQRDAEHDKPLATKGEVAARCVAGRNECQRGDESADTGREDLCNPDGRNENRSVNLPVHLVLLSLEGLRRLNDCAAVFAAVLALAPR